jgi:intracellular septation protein
MSGRRGWFPFTPEQTVNILSEFGPLVTMFVVNALFGWHAGTYALVATTVLAIIVMRIVLKRFPIFPLIASTVTLAFAAYALQNDDPKWIVLKVTVFNAMFAAFLLAGLALKRNFFKHVFEQTFHYTDEGWNKFTFNFSLFFILTAIMNEAIRYYYPPAAPGTPAELVTKYDILGMHMDGLSIWMMFKLVVIVPLSVIYAWYLTHFMHRHRLPDPAAHPETATVVPLRPAAEPARPDQLQQPDGIPAAQPARAGQSYSAGSRSTGSSA